MGPMELNKGTGFMIKLIHDAISVKANSHLQEYDLTLSQMRVLAFLGSRRGEPVSQKELEKIFHVKHPTMIGILRRLANKGFVQSTVNPRDKRSREIRLTEKGKNVQTEMMLKPQQLERIMHRGLSETQIVELSQMLQTIYLNIIES